MKKIAINGFGRIGRNILRSLHEENKYLQQMHVVAINDMGSSDINAHLLKYDSVHGKFHRQVSATENEIIIAGRSIAYFSERNPENLPWQDLDVDVVLECTGVFTSKSKALAHVKAGAKRVLVSAPVSDADSTVVYGVNHHKLSEEALVVSNASCTTNCLAPLLSVIDNVFGVEHALATTIHSYTNDQVLSDTYHSDPMRARAAALSMIPTKTGAAAAIGKILPSLDGKIDGLAVRVPVVNTSLVDVTVQTKVLVESVEQVNQAMHAASYGRLMGVLAYNNLPLVSSDFNHNSASSIYDASQTKVQGNQLKVLSWYDNEWGFACRMLDTASLMCNQLPLANPKNTASISTAVPVCA